MIIRDIEQDIVRATRLQSQEVNFRYVSEAVDILSNKGDYDLSLHYLTMNVPDGQNLLTMPREVDTVLKVNIDGTPSFSRDRLYEFTLNGPGSDAERVDFTWEQRGVVPILVPFPTNTAVPLVKVYATGNDRDSAKTLTVVGRNAAGEELSPYVLNINGAESLFAFSDIVRVNKEATLSDVSLYTKWVTGAPGAGDALLATYKAGDTEPQFRQIRVSKTGGTAYILFKRKNFNVTSLNDFVPIKSKRALLEMIKALRKYDGKEMEEGKKSEDLAVEWANQEQKKTSSFIELASATEIQPIRGLNINNRDSLIAADLFDDLDRIFGKVGTPKLYDRLTESLELLNNKGQWDGLVGWVDILTDQYHYITWPRYVEAILAMNICNRPTSIRNSWFEFHLNGPGGWASCCDQPRDAGDVVTFRDVNYSQKLVAIPDLSSDIGTPMRGYGYYQGKRIMTADLGGVLQDGFPIDVNMSGATSTNQFVDRIDRITKGVSNGFIKLLGFDSSRNVQTTLGYYWPDETEPRYKRSWIPTASATVRIKYRKRTLKIGALTDPLHLTSKTAVVRMLMSIKFMDEKDYKSAEIERQQAIQFMTDEQNSNNPLSYPELEFEDDGVLASNFVI